MIIVAGSIYVAEEDRAAFLESCREVLVAARATEGCLDFHMAGDLLEDNRINVYEAWECATALEAFRDGGPDDSQLGLIRSARVHQYEATPSTDEGS